MRGNHQVRSAEYGVRSNRAKPVPPEVHVQKDCLDQALVTKYLLRYATRWIATPRPGGLGSVV